MMKIGLFRLFRRDPTIDTLYGAIVAQARQPVFYRDWGVPDAVTGRFEMLILHLALTLDRLAEAGAKDVGDRLFDRFCRDMDDHLREMGVGDLAVPKQMRKLGEAFFGRRAAYRKALGEADGPGLIVTLVRNVYDGDHTRGAEALADYVRRAVRELAAQQTAEIARGRLAWPPLQDISRP
jgi:cytochrome b pre-mRNA-processing protein 3